MRKPRTALACLLTVAALVGAPTIEQRTFLSAALGRSMPYVHAGG